MTDIDQEVGFHGGAREKLGIDFRVVEARHRAGVEAQRSQRQNEVGALQRAVAKRGVLDQIGLANEGFAHVPSAEIAAAEVHRTPDRSQ